MWWSIFVSFIKTDLGKKVLGGVAIALVLGAVTLYIKILNGRIEDALDGKKQAENNIILVTKEFDILYSRHTNLEADYDEQKEYHAYSIKLLNARHKKDLIQVKNITKIKTEIANVKAEDDGEVSTILNNTLDSIRLLD